jgi:hypothetical protein
MPANETKVLFIIGKGRSGSTLLDVALGALDGYFASGELHFIWDRGVLENRRCGCGRPILECPLWSEALAATARETGFDTATMAQWHDEIYRWPRIPRMLRIRPDDLTDWPILEGYARISASLYRAVQTATGARVIVDSSKWPAGPGPLGLIPGIDPYVVHLVRDPRAVAHSWQRTKLQHDMDRPREMPRFGPWHSALSWTARNVVAGRVAALSTERSVTVRYEDFVAHPRNTMHKIIDLVAEPSNLDDILTDGTIHLGENHTVAGNPARFSGGEVRIRPDVEWEHRLGTAARRTVTAVTLPWLRRYRYPIRVPASRPESQ